MNNFKQISRTFMAMFGDPIRIQILEIFREKKEGVTPSEIADILFSEIFNNPDKKHIAISKISSHLSVLSKNNIITGERKSKNNVYKINPEYYQKEKFRIENYLIQVN